MFFLTLQQHTHTHTNRAIINYRTITTLGADLLNGLTDLRVVCVFGVYLCVYILCRTGSLSFHNFKHVVIKLIDVQMNKRLI